MIQTVTMVTGYANTLKCTHTKAALPLNLLQCKKLNTWHLLKFEWFYRSNFISNEVQPINGTTFATFTTCTLALCVYPEYHPCIPTHVQHNRADIQQCTLHRISKTYSHAEMHNYSHRVTCVNIYIIFTEIYLAFHS